MRHYIIPIFIPHFGCPHHCVFCNQRKITGVETNITPEHIAELLDFHLQGITRPYEIEAAFYGGSFTALSMELQRKLLAPAAARLRQKLSEPGELPARIDSIRLSTRPDYINEEILAMLWQNGVRTIELGAQSFAEQVLEKAERAHTAEDIREAAGKIRAAGFQLGIQLMPGLPGEDEASLAFSLQQTLALRPDLVRIYPTLVIRDTKLAELYETGCYVPLSLEQAVGITAKMKRAFDRAGIEVIRMGLQSAPELDRAGTVLAGPYHPAFGELVESRIFYDGIESRLRSMGDLSGKVVLHHAPQDTSQVRGLCNRNLKAWQQQYPEASFCFIPDGKTRGEVCIAYGSLWYTIHKDRYDE